MRRATRPARDGGRERPQEDEGRRDGQGVAARDAGDDPGGDGQRDPAGHPPIEAGHVERQAELRLRGREPLEQAATTDQQAIERADDGVGHQPRLVREEREQQRHLGRRQCQVGADGAHVAAFRDPEPAWHEAGEEGQEGGQGQDRQVDLAVVAASDEFVGRVLLHDHRDLRLLRRKPIQ